jgi:hypothetical protein
VPIADCSPAAFAPSREKLDELIIRFSFCLPLLIADL